MGLGWRKWEHSHCRIWCGGSAFPPCEHSRGTQLELVHRGGWVEVDIVGEGAGLEGECHTLKDHFLVEVWCPKGCLTKVVNERSEWFALFLSNAQEGDCGSLMWAAASEIGGEHVGESVEAVDGVGWKGCEPF